MFPIWLTLVKEEANQNKQTNKQKAPKNQNQNQNQENPKNKTNKKKPNPKQTNKQPYLAYEISSSESLLSGLLFSTSLPCGGIIRLRSGPRPESQIASTNRMGLYEVNMLCEALHDKRIEL